MLRDFMGAMRYLRLHPLFTLSIALTLGLGLTANAGVFTVVYGVVFRPLPFVDPDSLIFVWSQDVTEGVGQLPSSPADFYDVREQAEGLEALAGYTISQLNVKLNDRTVRRSGGVVTPGFFELLGARPLHGRLFHSEDFERGSTRGVLLHESFWREQYGGDTGVLGELIEISGAAFEIVGILPDDVKFNTPVDLWMPLAISRSEASRQARFLLMIGRLGDGYTKEAVEEELDLIAQRLAADHPETNRDRRFEVRSLRSALTLNSESILASLFVASAILLVLATINAAHLALVQVTNRRGELAMRLAVGGSRPAIARRLVVEALLLGMGGCALGLLGAALAVHLSVKLGFIPLGGAHRIAFDQQTVLYGLAVSAGLSLLMGVVASTRIPVRGLNQALTAAEEVSPGGAKRNTVRDLLFIFQVAAAFVLVVAAGSMIRELHTLANTETGFDTDEVMTITTVFPSAEYPPGSEALRSYLDRAVRELESLAAVEAAASGILSPIEGGGMRRNLKVTPSRGGGETQELESLVQPVSPTYFKALGVKVLMGRAFRREDTGRAVVVNRRFADLYLGGQPIGAALRLESPFSEEPVVLETVGVVEAVRQGDPREDPLPAVYVTHDLELMPFATFFVRSDDQSREFRNAVTKAVSQLDPDVAVDEPIALREAFRDSIQRERALAWLLGAFGVLALAVALLGIYGIMSLIVARRTREFGIRFSLGAERTTVLSEVLWKSAKLTMAGVVLGVLLIVLSPDGVQGLFSEAEPSDGLFLASVGVFIAITSLAGSFIPALRASRVSPLVAIRLEH